MAVATKMHHARELSFAHGINSKSAILFAIQCLLLRRTLFMEVEGMDIDMNDILNNQMMPLDMFLLDLDPKLREIIPVETQSMHDLTTVLKSMTYHRQMMQQFMATGYLAKQILNQTGQDDVVMIEKRIGKMLNESNGDVTDERVGGTATAGSVQKLLYDDGSAQYMKWLKRKTTLEDIQRHLQQNRTQKHSAAFPIRRQTVNPQTDILSNIADDDFDDGDITGYAYDGVPSTHIGHDFFKYVPYLSTPVTSWPQKNRLLSSYMSHINKNGYDSPFDDYVVQSSPPEHTISVSQSSKQTKEISLKDITDIALTTLAFLSFGMFILQVLMCITMSKDDGSNLMMLPMEATESSDPIDGTDEIRRRKRSIQIQQDQLEGVNQVSRHILNSIDSVLLLDDKRGNTTDHYRFLCNYTAFSKKPSNAQRLWMPLWSLGVSWLAAHISHNYISMLKSLAHMYKTCS